MMGENIGGAILLIFVIGVSGILTVSDTATLIIGVSIVTLGDINRGVTVLTDVKVIGDEVTITVDGSLLVTMTGDSLVLSLVEVKVTATDDSLPVITAGISLIVSAEIVTDDVDSRQFFLTSSAFLQSIIAP